jgi:hypothetical protein
VREHTPAISFSRAAICVAALLIACINTAVAADAPTTAGPAAQLPTFQPGLWEYRRTQLNGGRIKPQTVTIRKCGDPSNEIRQKLADLRVKGCQFTPMVRNGDRYVSSWVCPNQGSTVAFHDVVTVKSAQSYEDASEARQAQQVVRSKIEATRIGDCTETKSPRSSPATPRPVTG